MTTVNRATGAWWDPVDVSVGDGRHWHIGPLKLWVERGKREWRITVERGSSHAESTLVTAAPFDLAVPSSDAVLLRCAFDETPERVRLTPVLPDRNLVVSPADPFMLLAGQEVTLFVSVPLWIRIEVGDPPILLTEEPVSRPSDTWFGPSTREGALAYWAWTSARLDAASISPLPQRCVCAVSIHNRAKSTLSLERLQLPVQNLSVFASDDHQLWTQPVDFDRDEDGEMASVRLDPAPPETARNPRQLSGPRDEVTRNIFMRTFGSIFK